MEIRCRNILSCRGSSGHLRSLACQQQRPWKGLPGANRCSLLQVRASADDDKDEADKSLEEEARLEALERGVRRKQGARAVSTQMRRVEVSRNASLSERGMAPWKEGELFPEGWENMPVTEKIAELYTGKRGLLFWAGKVTYALTFALMAGWVIFRFILPQLGILELQNGLDSPPNMG